MADIIKTNSLGVAQVPFIFKDVSAAQDGSAYALATVGVSAAGNAVTTGVPSSDGVNPSLTASSDRAFGYVWNGTAWDRLRKTNIYKRVASSAAAGNPDFARNAAADLKQFWGLNTTATVIYLHFYNKASAPVLGTDQPVMSFPIQANERFNVSLADKGSYFSTGIAFAFTTDIAGIPATGTAAAAVTALSIQTA